MRYKSTRASGYVSGKEAILQGISPEGGLYVPEYFPKADWKNWKDFSYSALAKEILSLYFPEIENWKKILEPYHLKFPEPPVHLTQAEEVYLLELFHGPTSAFKDMALSVLPGLLKESAEEEGEVCILTATSGDTGKAAMEGFAGVEGTKIIVFYPHEGVSPIQAKQMLTQEGDNVFVFPIKGNFDEAQQGVKKIFTDKTMIEKLEKKGIRFSSANSINIGRLISQIVYYVYAYLELWRRGDVEPGEKIDIAVPTGNFGNILAAYYAKQMGLPVEKLICASNDNRVLTDFFETRHYNANRPFKKTSSPSMDILVSGNLERLLYHLREDEALIKMHMDELKAHGAYTWSEHLPSEWVAYAFGEEEVAQGIKALAEERIFMDPHTAIAYQAAKKWKKESGENRKIVVAATASPFKFPKKVLESLKEGCPEDPFEQLKRLEEVTGQKMPKAIAGLKEKPIRYHQIIDKDAMAQTVEEVLL